MSNDKNPMTEAGIEGFEVTSSHYDVNGKWGGHKAWIVHFKEPDSEEPWPWPQRTELYRHIGAYWEVGSWPGDPGLSRWGIVNKLLDLLDNEMPLRELPCLADDIITYRNQQRKQYTWPPDPIHPRQLVKVGQIGEK